MSTPVRIGINTVFLNPHRQGGAETYTRQLVLELLKRSPAELSPFQFVLFSPQQSEFLHHPQLRNHSRFELVLTKANSERKFQRIWWEQTRFPRLLQQHQLDLMHFPYGTMSVRYPGKSVVTVHDTLRFCFPEQMPLGQRLYRGWNERALRRENVHVISVSKADANLIHEHLQVPRNRLSVAYHGVSPEFLAESKKSTGRDLVSIQDPMLLWVGRPYPRKNVEVLFQIVRQLKTVFGLAPMFTLIGVESTDRERLQSEVERAQVQELVDLRPPLAHQELPAELSQFDFFLYPSLYESFGIPVLEAMAAGISTLGADIAPFRELFDEGITLCPASSPNAWARELSELCQNAERRQKLREQGMKRAQEFTWSRCVDEHLELFRRLTL
ncbi:MAG: glycosyltransferase family 4 protein [Planctomycetaceae bacterium]|nr:glycosyltransferase family 4 protein [Planctomycetaceae bacterium]